MKRATIKKFIFALLLVACVSFMAPASNADDAYATYKEAILFSIVGNVLRYDSVHTADITNVTVVVDNTGSGINTLDALKAVLGSPDIPPRVFQTIEKIDVGQRTLGNKAVTATLEIGQSQNQDRKVVSITITGIRLRPIIGVSWSTATAPANTTAGEGFERLGAYTVYLPRVSNATEARTVLSQLNGFAATGGEDWHPALYAEGVTPHGSNGWNVTRDISDLNMLQQAVAMDVPLLGFCRGKQGFNIAMGGGLIQDVPYYNLSEVRAGRTAQNRVSANLAATDSHRVYKPEDIYSGSKFNPGDILSGDTVLLPYSGTGLAAYTLVSCDATCSPRVYVDGLVHSGGLGYHPLEPGPANIGGIKKDSKWLYKIIGHTNLQWIRTAHHQFANPNKLGKGITIAAYASDGVVEAIEHKDSLFALGVQWHPEANVLSGPSNPPDFNLNQATAILRELAKYAGIHKDRKEFYGVFKDGEVPSGLSWEKFEFEGNKNWLEHGELIIDKGTLLSDSMLDGWRITGVDPAGEDWEAEVKGGSVVVTLDDVVTNDSVTVTLTKNGSTETKEIVITFSGKITIDDKISDDKKPAKKGSGGGCNAAAYGITILLLLGIVRQSYRKR